MSDSRRLRVMHLTYDMRIGGTEQVIRNIVDGAENRGLDMYIFCIETPLGPWGEDMRATGTTILSKARRPGFDLSLVKAIRRCLKDERIDVLHCHQYTPWVYGALAAAGLATRVVFTEHGRFYPDTRSLKRRLVNPLLMRLTRHATAISAATAQALIDYEYLPAKQINVIYNGIRPLAVDSAATAELRRELGIPPDAVVLGTVARFDPIKNHAMMLHAFRRVQNEHSNAYLLIVGDGEERANMERLITELGITEQVLLPGYIAQPEVWLDAMDLFLLSSLSEGTSMTLLEAMSLSKPCVVTDVGGNPEIVIHKQTGLVTTNNDELAFANAILRLLNEKGLREMFGATGRKRFLNEFTRDAMNDRYETLYRENIAGSCDPDH
ncbi:glycosyltransferase [Congregibacter variabilis]|uniref:Glycosyltransferase n=1 Tax=Congregibacter variabilis TaxID=3081200 RepID=A0ABZ0I7L6_9GAMM|nr:glycosyltransferase [Congregibacter sp. IMCC43200]